ncbi:MAG: hypothetical protein KGY41_05220 [Desulfovermiculus sp.]|nr:hypothetical protein [Desulfovermiculus sp.]
MNGVRKGDPWQLTELNKYLKSNAEDRLLDSKTVFLCNPSEKAELHRVLCQHFWPAVLDALANMSIRVLESNNSFPDSEIEDEKHLHTTSSLTFVLEDPAKPLVPGFCPPWFYRGKLECSIFDYMISSEFYLHLPSTIGFSKVHKLLSDPMFEGNPPDLSVYSRPYREEIWTVAFSEGSGASLGMGNYHDAAQHVYKKVELSLAVIRAVNVLNNDYQNTAAFKSLQTALREAYQAY